MGSKYIVKCQWCGETPSEIQEWQFNTTASAWKHIAGRIERHIKFHEHGKYRGKTELDLSKFKRELMETGHANVEFCKNPKWRDHWEFKKIA